MRKMKAVEVVLDYDIYPRNNIDSHNVTTIADALVAGATFGGRPGDIPPILIDKKSKRVIDGFHRVKAVLRAFGDDGELMVLERVYRNDADMFLDAMRYNAGHGVKLDPCDRTRCVLIAERLKVPLEAVAGALHMPIEKLGNLRHTRTAQVGTLTVPLKRTLQSFAGRHLTKRQQQANVKLSGMNQQFYANQLIELIEAKLIDDGDEKLLHRLRHLHSLLDDLLCARR